MHLSRGPQGLFKFLPMGLIFIGLISGVPARGWDPREPVEKYWAERREIEAWGEKEDRRKQRVVHEQNEQYWRQFQETQQQRLQQKQADLEKQVADPQHLKQQPQAQQAPEKDGFDAVYAAYRLENGEKSGNEDSVLGPCEYVPDEAIGSGFSVPSGCDKSSFQVRSVSCKSLAGKVAFVSTCKIDGAELSANRCADQHMAPLIKKAIDKKTNGNKSGNETNQGEQ